MSLDTAILSGLTDYVNQLNPDIQRQTILKGRFVDQISHMGGIKNAEVINAITSVLVTTAPSCGVVLSPSGSVTPYQNTLTVCYLETSEILCYDEFEKKYYGMFAKEGSYNEYPVSSFVDVYMADKFDKVPEAIERDLVCAATSGTFSTYATTLCQGMLSLFYETSASASVVNATGLSTSYGITNAVTTVDTMYSQVFNGIRLEKDLTLWMSYGDFDTYRIDLRNKNLYHFNSLESEGGMVYEMYHPGTSLKISALHGLDFVTNGHHYFILASAKNFFYGFDSIGDVRNCQFWYEQLTDAVNFRMKYKIGFGVAKYNEVTIGKI